MEGLIPMVFKALKKNRVRSQYECLSSKTPAQSYNIADFYNSVYHNEHSSNYEKVEESSHHRRHKSVGDFYSNGGGIHGGDGNGGSPRVAKQLVRFGSHRMFSCVTG
ncbi:hypothetical protein Patl1_27053 [Pistacia atlantica]|uniref:Uncharacterized protein n=1 Tax=Pistacia atlantica TaxID=434234 RepID=A0ACC1B106_9ROSI|nr:hypothetical protein Patl1_27053 [Pistacia atlantica]